MHSNLDNLFTPNNDGEVEKLLSTVWTTRSSVCLHGFILSVSLKCHKNCKIRFLILEVL